MYIYIFESIHTRNINEDIHTYIHNGSIHMFFCLRNMRCRFVSRSLCPGWHRGSSREPGFAGCVSALRCRHVLPYMSGYEVVLLFPYRSLLGCPLHPCAECQADRAAFQLLETMPIESWRPGVLSVDHRCIAVNYVLLRLCTQDRGRCLGRR